ncbi:MAG: hypothetical protein K2U26_08530, partial [Cyclobacteriaceae bacterium]|nr:hypothetical protein [Cyclobacteriaceae bacterium]
MYVTFETMPSHARVWVYQAGRSFTVAEQNLIVSSLRQMCEQWKAHGTPLHTSFTLPHNHFLVLAVDKQQAGVSGCSIDGSVRAIKELQQQTGIDFFDRTAIAFYVHGAVVLHPMSQLKFLFESGALSGSSLTFNNLVDTKGDFDSRWLQPVAETWV